ncbi:hypothetical protein [Nocardia arizonensis]|uniref:hypothetical protein n=1 Tax=Nocardia arizonensis TaxID=1141647 RepID=UPI0006D20C8C|nr:hypothetical protein [Nocardia arizonensis]
MDVELILEGFTHRSLLRQAPAVIVHPAFFVAHRIRPWTIATLEFGKKRRRAWLVPASADLLCAWERVSWSGSVWISIGLAERMGIEPADTGVEVRLCVEAATARVQPARIDNFLETDQIVLDAAARKRMTRRVLLVSESRTMIVRPVGRRRSRRQAVGRIRLNFHARMLLGIVPGAVTDRQYVQMSPYRPVGAPVSIRRMIRRAVAAVPRLPLLVLEYVARALLGAPRVALAIEESGTSDDPHGLARIPKDALDLLGIESGDKVFVYWGRRRVLVRACSYDKEASDHLPDTRIIDWTPTARSARVEFASRIALPAKFRTRLGAPRNGVVVLRRSLNSRLRRKLIALTIPVLAVTLSILKLDLDPVIAAGIVAAVLFCTLIGERMSSPSWRAWP